MKKETLKILKSNEFLNNLIYNTEIYVSKSLWQLCENKKNLQNYLDEASKEDIKARTEKSNEISVYIGAALHNVICPTLKEFGISCLSQKNEKGDLLIDGETWELKTSKQGEKKGGNETIQGSTHSGSKCNNYIFIRYGVDWNKKFVYKTKPNNFINQLHVSAHFGIVKKEYWVGKAGENNSRTTLNVPILESDNFNKGVIYGIIKPAKKWLHFKMEEFNLKGYTPKTNCLKELLEF